MPVPPDQRDLRPVSPDYVSLRDHEINEERLWCQGEHKLPGFKQWRAQVPGALGRPAQGSRLLDAGCGTGGFMSFAGQVGFDVYGFDASPAQAAHAARSFESVRTATSGRDYVRALGREGLRFHVATLWDVLEHVREPIQFLTGLRAVMEPGGLDFVSVPNGGAMVWKRLVQRIRGLPEGFGWAPWEHVFYHSFRSLKLAHVQAGLLPIRSGAVACYRRPLSVFETLRRCGFLALRAAPPVAPQIYLWSKRAEQ